MRISKYLLYHLIILLFALSILNVFPKPERYIYAASISSNKIAKIPKAVKNKIKNILGNVKYLLIKTDKAQNFIITVQKDETKYEVFVNKNKKILKILRIVGDNTPDMGC